MGFGRTADSLFDALILDVWPQGPGVYVDYGLDEATYPHYQRAVKSGGVTADDLHRACGSGRKLSALIGAPVRLTIDWDDMGEE